jgi:hypothetical protein
MQFLPYTSTKHCLPSFARACKQIPRKKVEGKDEQMLKIKPDVEKLKKMYDSKMINIYSLGESGNTLLLSALKFVTLQQRQSKKKLISKPEPIVPEDSH